MKPDMFRDVEKIHTRTFGRGARTIGITAPQTKSGVSTMARSLAARCASSGQKSILVDMSHEMENPYFSDKTQQTQKTAYGQKVWRDHNGYDVLPINKNAIDKHNFHDAHSLQQLLKEELEGYEQIVLDLSHVPHSGLSAAACDAVVLVCRTYSVTRAAVEASVKSLSDHNAKIAGLVMNDQNAPTLAQEMFYELSRLQGFLPKGIRNFIEKKIIDNKVLNTRP